MLSKYRKEASIDIDPKTRLFFNNKGEIQSGPFSPESLPPLKVAIEAVREEKTATQIASAAGVHPMQVSQWKKELLTRASELFQDKRKKTISGDEDNAALFEQIGRLKVELEWLKKKSEGSRR